MLLLHQLGAVKVGEVVRYTVTYTPTFDRILPPPTHLHVRIKNTSAIPLRAAYLHGPYTLYAACYPSTFDPNVKHSRHVKEGAPDYEPQLKAGGHWSTKLTIPEETRTGVENGERNKEGERKSFTWIVEVASQVLFSTTAAVHYEVLVGRDEKSVVSGFSGAIHVSSGHGIPGKLEDLQERRPSPHPSAIQTKGVFSKAIRLAVDDTESLWNTPAFPSWDDSEGEANQVKVEEGPQHGDKRDTEAKKSQKQNKQKKIHLVILTHGIHSNVGADMLFMKESIDTAAKQAKEDAKQRKVELQAQQLRESNEFGRSAQGLRSKSAPESAIAPAIQESDDDDDVEEQVLVRGFKGNCVRTEKGIQYLGKRLAKYILSITYPDQPYLPVKSSISKTITRSLTGQKPPEDPKGPPTHKHSSIIKDDKHIDHNLAYKITSISFISHSLGGLVQTYAVAYIQKHSPEFFDRIKPINFVAMASPFLGLSNENPVYVKFALDFGLVGRTGQDLGLTWRAPNIARTGWEAMVNGLVNDPHKDKQPDPGAKPLLRILPTGPAHQALKKFRNRTVYSNVVNDGIVPLRTSCLLFLDWRGLGRVEKARRENGLVGTMVNWGWSEMTGQNASTAKKGLSWNDLFSDSVDDSGKESDDPGASVPQASASQDLDLEEANQLASKISNSELSTDTKITGDSHEQSSSPWTALMSYFRTPTGSKSVKGLPKSQRIYRRGQVMKVDDDDDDASDGPGKSSQEEQSVNTPRGPVRGASLYNDNSDNDCLEAPPKTTFFESAGDLLRPPLPSKEFLLDPAARPRTIFHDRVYHPDDIPPPPVKRQRTFMRMNGSHESSVPHHADDEVSKAPSGKPEPVEQGSMKIEEKIARAYHKDMAWRKVLVRLEPDAHNNMIVRRMFANAYGWPVVKHMCDTHFAYTAAARTRDEDEDSDERAQPINEAVGSDGEQVKGQERPPNHEISLGKTETPPKSASFSAKDRHGRELNTSLRNEVLRTVHSNLVDEEHNQRRRTPSEVRESRDHVSDLVSIVTAQGQPSTTFSSMHSSTSSNHSSATGLLHRLHRQDSGRWSDRFFEGDDEDDEEEDKGYHEELRKAQYRGGIRTIGDMHESLNRVDGGSSPQQERTIDDTGQTILYSKDSKLVQEPEELDIDNNETMQPEEGKNDLTPVQSINATNLGLGKDVAEQIGRESPIEKKRRGSSGIVEQVAVAQTHDHDHKFEHDNGITSAAKDAQIHSPVGSEGGRMKEDKK